MQDGLKRVLDYSDYLAAPEDGKRYEIVRGNLLVTPAPRPSHQRTVARLFRALDRYFEARGAELFISPIDLILSNNDIVQPDLLVVDNPALVSERGIEGAPLLVIEVLSKATADRDRGVKARRYAECGIRHYWLVDPESRRIEFHELTKGVYQQVGRTSDDTPTKHSDFPGLSLNPALLWSDPA